MREPAEAVATVWGTAMVKTWLHLQRQQVDLRHVTLRLQERTVVHACMTQTTVYKVATRCIE